MSRSTEASELHEAILEVLERLGQQIQVLTEAVDQLSTELQWQNNQSADCRRSPALRVRSMPADPAAKDWQLNRSRREDLSPPARSPTGNLFE